MAGGQKMPALEDVPSLAEAGASKKGEKPMWLKVLVRTKFWKPCQEKEHQDLTRGEGCRFCLDCYEVICPHCRHDEPGHRLLKVRRYLYRSAVLVTDMQDLGIDVPKIQQYVINSQKIVHLRPMKRSKFFRPPAGTPQCLTCQCYLHYGGKKAYKYCSLVCEEEEDVSPDYFSGSEAEERLKSLHNMEPPVVVEHENEPEAIDNPPEPSEAPPVANQGHIENDSFRKRSRKQVVPQRAPFF